MCAAILLCSQQLAIANQDDHPIYPQTCSLTSQEEVTETAALDRLRNFLNNDKVLEYTQKRDFYRLDNTNKKAAYNTGLYLFPIGGTGYLATTSYVATLLGGVSVEQMLQNWYFFIFGYTIPPAVFCLASYYFTHTKPETLSDDNLRKNLEKDILEELQQNKSLWEGQTVLEEWKQTVEDFLNTVMIQKTHDKI